MKKCKPLNHSLCAGASLQVQRLAKNICRENGINENDEFRFIVLSEVQKVVKEVAPMDYCRMLYISSHEKNIKALVINILKEAGVLV
ncbi:hypothetical protein CSB37_01640 [bacterium DOLZORAL124_38_8]|nr:MAG: hypothetical protein CSB37_01640 [bacterium DOLZORAL124_38_8]